MKTLKIFLVMLMFICFYTGKLMSQWSQLGLTSDQVISLAIKSNGYIFAGTYNDGVINLLTMEVPGVPPLARFYIQYMNCTA